MMRYQPVESSNIDAVAHQDTTMQVRFKNGSEYAYKNVAPETFQEILGAASVGRSFHTLVKSHPELYPYLRLN